MAEANSTRSPLFLVYAQDNRDYPWIVKDAPDGNAVSRHGHLGTAVAVAERLNAGRAFDRSLFRYTVSLEVVRKPKLPAPVYAERESYQAKDARGGCQMWYEFGSDRAEASPCSGLGSITDLANGCTYCVQCWRVNRRAN